MSRLITGLLFITLFGGLPGYSQDGKKMSVAVMQFEVRGNVDIKDAGISIAEMLSVALVRTGVYNMYERVLLTKILEEQKLAIAGVVNSDTAAKVGEVFGVQAIISGSVIEWDKIFTVTVRVIDTSTGAILNSASFQVMKSSEIPAKMNDLADVLVGRKNSEILKASGLISDDYQKKSKGLGVILDLRKDNGDKLVINLGAENNVQPGMLFDVFVNQYKISDITGNKTYAGKEKVGELSINSVDPTMSMGSVTMMVGKGQFLDTLPKEGVVTYHVPMSGSLSIGMADLNTPILSYDFYFGRFFMSIGMGYALPNFLGNIAGAMTTKVSYGFQLLRSPLDALIVDLCLTALIYANFDFKSADSKLLKLSLNANVTFFSFLYAGGGVGYKINMKDGSGLAYYLDAGIKIPLF